LKYRIDTSKPDFKLMDAINNLHFLYSIKLQLYIRSKGLQTNSYLISQGGNINYRLFQWTTSTADTDQHTELNHEWISIYRIFKMLYDYNDRDYVAFYAVPTIFITQNLKDPVGMCG